MKTSIASYFVGTAGGLMMSIIAFCIVFAVIFGLMVLMMLLKHFAAWLNDYSEFASSRKSAKKQPESPATPPAAAAARAAGDDGELVAVITAAIAAAHGPGAVTTSGPPARPERMSCQAMSPWRIASIQQNSLGLRD